MSQKTKESSALDAVYNKQSELILDAMKNADLDNFRLPWQKAGVFSATNVLNDKLYKGSNAVYLGLLNQMKEFKFNVWGTLNQFKSLDIRVKKEAFDQKYPGISVFSAPRYSKSSGKTGMIPKGVDLNSLDDDDYYWVRRYTRVFNLDETENWQECEKLTAKFNDEFESDIGLNEVFSAANDFVNSVGVPILESRNSQAYYSLDEDAIYMPKQGAFAVDKTQEQASEDYYSVLLHELTHSTGAEKRLNRFSVGKQSTKEEYAFEELVAELGAAFLCNRLGITQQPRLDHASYLKSWISCLEDDLNAFHKASSLAQRSTDYLFSLQKQNEKNKKLAA